MATHYSILAWKIPWTVEPGHLQSMGSQRVKHDWVCTHRHRRFCLCLQSLEWEPNKAVRIICGFYFWKKFKLIILSLDTYQIPKKFSFEHCILVIAYLYSCVAIITIWSRMFYILSPYKDTQCFLISHFKFHIPHFHPYGIAYPVYFKYVGLYNCGHLSPVSYTVSWFWSLFIFYLVIHSFVWRHNFPKSLTHTHMHTHTGMLQFF